MLQQTQVGRVAPKFEAFLRQFPTIQILAAASLGDVLVAWSGLGYNRRAKFLWQAAQDITNRHGGVMPQDVPALRQLPGIGVNTAGAIAAYAFNQPSIFVETNIRTVYIHHFFEDGQLVADAELIPLLAATLDHERPREWYWALMDYGTHLKQTVGSSNHLSKNYTRQSKFEGSLRQIRGKVMRRLAQGSQTHAQLVKYIADPRLQRVLADLVREQLVAKSANGYRLP